MAVMIAVESASIKGRSHSNVLVHGYEYGHLKRGRLTTQVKRIIEMEILLHLENKQRIMQ